MPRANAIVPPEAIRIEDEVWQEAFARREPARPNRRRLRAVEGGEPEWLPQLVTDAFSERITPADRRSPASEDRTAEAPVPRPLTAAAAAIAESTIAPPSASAAPPLAPAATASPPIRRTVKIQGRGAERHLPLPDPSRRRPSRRAYERNGFRPDRLAMWAVLLGFLLVLVAVASSHA